MYIRSYKKQGKIHYLFKLYAGVDPATGKEIHITRRGFKTKKEAEMTYHRLKLEIERDGFQQSGAYTFSEIYALWKEQYKNTVKESTVNKTEQIFRLHILPVLGKLKIDKIKLTHCQDAVNRWAGSVKNFKQVNNYAGLVFKHAMRLGIINQNPTELVTMPVMPDQVEEDDEDLNFYNKDELKALLESIKEPKWQMYFRLLAYSGMRKGEALALTWSDINFIDNSLTISKTLTVGAGNKMILQTPKTKKSKRVVTLDPGTMEALKRWKSVQAQEMLMLGFNTGGDGQLVFTNTKNRHYAPQRVGQILDRYCQDIGMRRITPHGFRHTHCSLLFEAGVSIKEVQDRLGHSDIKTTMNIYAHVTAQKKGEAADKFAAYIGY